MTQIAERRNVERRDRMRIHRALGMAVASVLLASSALAFSQASDCRSDEDYRLLDFMIGNWDVYVNGQLDGHNRIEEVAAGCAMTEYWTGADGSPAMGLFFVDPSSHGWSQVLVTDQATHPGGLKQRLLTKRLDGGVRFDGKIDVPGKGVLLERCSMTRLPDGRLQELKDQSRDNGKTWHVVYDAIYQRAKPL
jgi:hypothetical protein